MSGELTNNQMYPFLQERLERIESKLDFLLRQSARKESVALEPTAYSALAQAGMDPRQLQTHKVVTLLDDWEAEQESKEKMPTASLHQKFVGHARDMLSRWKSRGMPQNLIDKLGIVVADAEASFITPKEDGDEQR